MAEHLVEVPDAPGLAHDPRMQMQHHQPPGGRAVGIKPVEPLAPQQVDFVDRAPAVQVDVVVVEIGVDAERVELAGLRRHPVGLLVIAPVADIANAFGGEQVRGVRRLLEIGAGPADRARAGRPLDRRDRGADIVALLVFGHADMDDAPARQPVRDELGAALLALLDERRIVVGHRLVEREGRRDAVFVQHGENAKNPDPVAVFVVAPAADIGELRLVTGPHALGTAHRAHRHRRAGRHLPIPMLQVDDDRQRDPGVVRPSENRARDNWGPGIEVLVHAVGALCGHRSLRQLR